MAALTPLAICHKCLSDSGGPSGPRASKQVLAMVLTKSQRAWQSLGNPPEPLGMNLCKASNGLSSPALKGTTITFGQALFRALVEIITTGRGKCGSFGITGFCLASQTSPLSGAGGASGCILRLLTMISHE